jgi:putative ABC transport system substrate-binding protein
MRRRDFIKGIVGSAATWPLAARAQQPAIPVIGFLRGSTEVGSGFVVRAGIRRKLRGYSVQRTVTDNSQKT